jgi:hypothetical protein
MGRFDLIPYLLEALLAVNVAICVILGAPVVRYLLRLAIAVSLVRGRKS